MKSNIALLMGAMIIALILIALISVNLKKISKINATLNNEQNKAVEIQKINDDRLMEKVKQIAVCESSLNPKAINFRDRDGLTRFGMFQWLPSTFKEYGVKYGLISEKADIDWVMTIIWDEKINQRLVYLILKNEPQKAKQLWPNCY